MKRKASLDAEMPAAKTLKTSEMAQAQHQENDSAHAASTAARPNMKRKASPDAEMPAAKALKLSETAQPERHEGAGDHSPSTTAQQQAGIDGTGDQCAAAVELPAAAGGLCSDAVPPDKPDTAAEQNISEELAQAQEFLTLLVIVVEGRRQANDKQACAAQQARIDTLCAAAAQPGVSENYHLREIPICWFGDLGLVQNGRNYTKEVEERLDRWLSEMYHENIALDTAIARRTSVLFDIPRGVTWPAIAHDHNDEISAVRLKLSQLEETRFGLEKQLADMRLALEDDDRTMVFSLAERALLRLGLIQPRSGSIDQVTGASGNEAYREDASIPAPVTTAPKRAPSRYLGEDGSPSTLQNTIQNGKKADLRNARRAASEASRCFHDIRNRYHKELREFLGAKGRGEVIGTRTEFDATYFLERNRANHELGIAMADYEFVKQQARGVGVLRPEDITSNFDDDPNDGYDDISLQLDPVREMQREVVEAWRSNEQQKEVLSESKWNAQRLDGLEGDAGPRSIGALSGFSFDQLALGKRRKLIDRWKAHQEKLRASPEIMRLPYEARYGHTGVASRYWFQECSGI